MISQSTVKASTITVVNNPSTTVITTTTTVTTSTSTPTSTATFTTFALQANGNYGKEQNGNFLYIAGPSGTSGGESGVQIGSIVSFALSTSGLLTALDTSLATGNPAYSYYFASGFNDRGGCVFFNADEPSGTRTNLQCEISASCALECDAENWNTNYIANPGTSGESVDGSWVLGPPNSASGYKLGPVSLSVVPVPA